MKNYLLQLLVLIFTFSSFQISGQELEREGLWKGYEVKNEKGEAVSERRQDFIKVHKDMIVLLQFREMQNQQTGQVVLNSLIDTFTLIKNKQGELTIETIKADVKLKVINAKEIEVHLSGLILTFRHIESLVKPVLKKENINEFLVGSTFDWIDKKTGGKEQNFSRTYQEDGLTRYAETPESEIYWESPYMIIQFDGFIILKETNYTPIILTGISDDRLEGISWDYHYNMKTFEISRK